MRLRIVKRLRGEIDGVSLDQFNVGQTYDVGTTLASYFLALRVAVPVTDADAASGAPPDSRPRRARAADRGRSTRKLPRKTR